MIRSSSDMPLDGRDWILLSKMTLPCELGIFAWERRRTQPLDIEVGFSLDLEPAATGVLESSVDYSAIYEQVRFLARHGRWRLIESLAFAVVRHLLVTPSPAERRRSIDCAFVRLIKPEALQGRAIPQISVQRDRSHALREPPAPELGRHALLRLLETDEAGAYHVNLAPGASFEMPKGARGHVVAGELDCDGRRMAGREDFESGCRRLTNIGETEARVLLLAFPPLPAELG